MIKLKELIKEETKHSCNCGGDCCSVNESKGMELGKIFTGHGFAFKEEEFKESLPNKADGNDEPIEDEPDTEIGKAFSAHHAGSMGSGDMGKLAEPDTYDWDDSGSEPNKPGHQTKKNKKKRGYEPVEVKEGFEKYHLGNLLDSKLKKRLERAIKIWGGKVDAVGMDTIKFRMSSSEVTKFPALLKKLDQNKNVWIGDKRKKNIWDRKRKIDKLSESVNEWKKFRGKMTYGDAKPQKGDYVKTIAGIAQIEKIRGSIAYMKLPGKKTKGYWMNDIKNLKPTEKKEKGKTLWTESINEAKVLKFTDIKDRTLEKHLKVVTKKVGAELSKISGGFQVSGDMRALTSVVDYVFDKSIKKGVMKGGGMSKIQLANESINERTVRLSSIQKKAILIAVQMFGNMTGAVKKIEKLKKGLSKDKKVVAALRLANESIKENLIYVDKDMKDGKFDPKNPQVHIQGYGVVNLKTLQDSLSRKFTELAKRAKKGDFENIEHLIKKNSVIQGFVGAGVDTNKQLKTSQMKRKITMYKQKRYK